MLKKGDTAPAFSLADQFGKTVNLKDFSGKRVLVYFYGKALTSGWTKQAVSVRDARKELDEKGITAIGISPDKPETLKKFDEKYKLDFILLSDQDRSVANAYGAYGKKMMYGKEVSGIIRSVILIDERGIVFFVKYKISPEDTVPLVLTALNA